MAGRLSMYSNQLLSVQALWSTGWAVTFHRGGTHPLYKQISPVRVLVPKGTVGTPGSSPRGSEVPRNCLRSPYVLLLGSFSPLHGDHHFWCTPSRKVLTDPPFISPANTDLKIQRVVVVKVMSSAVRLHEFNSASDSCLLSGLMQVTYTLVSSSVRWGYKQWFLRWVAVRTNELTLCRACGPL